MSFSQRQGRAPYDPCQNRYGTWKTIGSEVKALALPVKQIKNMNSESQTDDIQADLLKAKAEFRHVLKVACDASNFAANTRTDRQGAIADTLMVRNILAGICINQLLEPASVGGISALTCPDPFSIGTLARSVAETYLTMYGIGGPKFDALELEFRLLWWDWYDINEQIRTRDLIKSAKPGVEKLDERKANLSQKILRHPEFAQLPVELKRGFKKGEPPRRGPIETLRQLAKAAGIHPDRFEVMYQVASSSSHCDPIVARLLQGHQPIDEEIVRLLKLHLIEATAFLAFTVNCFAQLLSKARVGLDQHFVKIHQVWSAVFANPF